MYETDDDALLTPGQLAKRDDLVGRVHERTVRRWITEGVSPCGDPHVRVHLQAARVGGRWKVSPRQLRAFFAKLAPDVEVDGDAQDALAELDASLAG